MTKDEAIKWLDFKSGDIYDHVFYGDEAPEWEDYEYEALRMAIEALRNNRQISIEPVINGLKEYKEVAESLLQAFETYPTADVVEVVRCKDCKYYLHSNEKCELIDTRLHFYDTDNTWTEDAFCAWGERRESGNE